MRLFAGIPVDDAARSFVAMAVAKIKQYDVRARWVPPENWHVTLAFLGDIDDNRYDEIASGFRSVELPAPFSLSLSHVGAFPNRRRPRVLWVGGEQPPEFSATAHAVRSAFTLLGFQFEDDNAQAHVTIARMDGAAALLAHDLGASLTMPVTRIVLFESVRGPAGVRYAEREVKTIDRTR